MPMTKHLSKHGNSLALVIDRGILEMLDIDEKTTLSVSTDGKTLFVSKRQDAGRVFDLSRGIGELVPAVICPQHANQRDSEGAETGVGTGKGRRGDDRRHVTGEECKAHDNR